MKPHIVHIVGTLNAGGVQKLVIGLARASALHGFRHSVLCVLGAEGELRSEFRAAGLDVLACPIAWPAHDVFPSYRASKWLRDRLAITFELRLAALLRRERVDLVHTHLSTRPGAQAMASLRLARRPFVWTIHGLYPTEREPREWRRAFALTRTRSVITADSGPVADRLVEHGLVSRDRLRVVHAGADTARFARPIPRDPAWRARWRIPASATVLGTSGRLVEAKAHDVLIDAASIVANSCPELHIVIAGAGPLEGELQAQIARLGLQARVHMLGFVDDVPALLHQLDGFILSSRSEGFPLALIEALAAGLPVVATAVGGVREMLGDRGGIIVEPEQPELLAAGLAELAVPATRRRLAGSAAAIADAFSFERCAEHFAAIYRELLSA